MHVSVAGPSSGQDVDKTPDNAPVGYDEWQGLQSGGMHMHS